MRRLASIDIGSQTIRLLVADVASDGVLLPVLKKRAIIRLGEGVADRGYLNNEAMQRAVECIADFTSRAKKLGAEAVYAAATACVRNAENKSEFIHSVRCQAGIVPLVLSGEQEAGTCLAGVLSVVHAPHETMLVFDIGGGSTEYMLLQSNRVVKTESMPLGVISLTERYLTHDPPDSMEIHAMRCHIVAVLSRCGVDTGELKKQVLLVGTAGTVTTLAAMDMAMTAYDPEALNGYLLTRDAIQKLYEQMLRENIHQRSSMTGLEPGRASVMPAGTAIVLEIMHALKQNELLVSDAGLLEGILILQSSPH